jgi:hypothetical protein
MSVLHDGILRALQHVFIIGNLSDLVATDRQETLLGKPIVYEDWDDTRKPGPSVWIDEYKNRCANQ